MMMVQLLCLGLADRLTTLYRQALCSLPLRLFLLRTLVKWQAERLTQLAQGPGDN
jgi:hypothetical protein